MQREHWASDKPKGADGFSYPAINLAAVTAVWYSRIATTPVRNHDTSAMAAGLKKGNMHHSDLRKNRGRLLWDLLDQQIGIVDWKTFLLHFYYFMNVRFLKRNSRFQGDSMFICKIDFLTE